MPRAGLSPSIHLMLCNHSQLFLMLGTAAGPACKTCREKCRKCDRGRPKCQRCISKGLECGGYPDQYRFCGIASRGRWKGARVPTPRNTKAKSTVAESQQVSTTATPDPDTPGRAKDVATQPSSKPSRSATELPDDIPKILNLTQTEMLLSHCKLLLAGFWRVETLTPEWHR
jgi:hypothetical protein